MKIREHIDKASEPLITFEIVPPPRGHSVNEIISNVEILAEFRPPWIDVTSHSSVAYFHEKPDGSIQKKIFKKRPGTMGICGIIQNRFKIDTVAHILCLGFTREETEDALIELNFLGVHNVLALRGDAPNYKKEVRPDRSVNQFACDLVEQIKGMREGHFIDHIEESGTLDFGIGVAGYPEKHFEAANLKTDIHWLKAKVDSGADYVVTQMFFDNSHYFNYIKLCRENNIDVPIVPGIKVIKSASQLRSLPKSFNIDIPIELSDEILENPNHAPEIGKNWALKQAQELIDKGAPGVHFYVLNDVPTVTDVVRQLCK